MPSALQNFERAFFRRLRRSPPSGFVARAAFWLLAIAVSCFVLHFLPGAFGSLFTIFAFIAGAALGVSVCLLLYRWISARLLWRVSNRLVVTYLLIGLAPVVLFVTLAGIAAYVFSGQFATYSASQQVNDELERLSAENRAYAIHIGHALAVQRGKPIDLPERSEVFGASEGHQNLQLQIWDNGALLQWTPQGFSAPTKYAGAPLAPPSWVQSGFKGIVADDHRLFLRAFDRHRLDGHTVLLLSSIPLGPATLDRLARGLGEVSIFPSFELEQEPGTPQPAVRNPPPRGSLRQRAGEASAFETLKGGVLPPAAYFLDMRVFFTAPLNTIDWQTGRQTTALMNVTSRPTLLYQRLFGTAVKLGTIIRDALITIGILFALLELIAFIMAVRLSRTITRSVADLYGATTEIDHGNFAHRIQVTRHDQLAALSTSFNRMSESLERLLEQQREKDRMQNELAIAQEVQNNLFPHTDLRLPALELHGVCKPARTVSGDYYDFLLVGQTELCLAMGDISGKGISAALLMASLHSAVRAYRFAGEELGEADRAAGADASPFSSPGKMLGLLNRHLYRSTQPEKYATLFLAYYNSDTRKLTYSTGGQLPPFVLCMNGSIRRLDCGGSVIGLLDGLSYEQATVKLDAGDILIAYSDGVTEPENDFGEFGEERLLELVARHRHSSLNVISGHVLQALRTWIGDNEQPDDITLVLARQA